VSIAVIIRNARRALREEADDWRVPGRVAEALFLAPLAGAALLLAVAPFRRLFVALTREDGPLEWGEVAAWGLVVAFASMISRRLWATDQRLPALLYALLAFGAIFVMGEEVSWGQRIFRIDTPAALRAENEQGETTLHNLRGIHLEYRVALFLVGAYGSVLVYAARGWVRERWPAACDLFLPPLFLTSPFLVQAAYRGVRLFWLNEPITYLWGFGEWPELCMPAAIAAFSCLNLRRAAAGAPAAAAAAAAR